jgi:hypothetical protein
MTLCICARIPPIWPDNFALNGPSVILRTGALCRPALGRNRDVPDLMKLRSFREKRAVLVGLSASKNAGTS